MSPKLRMRVLVAAVFSVAAVAFGVLAVAVSQRAGPLGPDQRLLHDVVDWRSGGLTALGKTVTTFGTDYVVYPLLVLGALVCWRRTGRVLVGIVAIGILISGQLVRLGINHTIARARPPAHLHLVSAGGYAFPSGHTTNATLTYTLLAILLSRSFPRGRWGFAAGAAILAVAVGLSRVYLAVHWATDVAGGWLLGISWLTLAALLAGTRTPHAGDQSGVSGS